MANDELRSRYLRVLLTPRERDALRIVAAHNKTSASALLRDRLDEVLAEYDEIQKKLSA